MKGYQIQEAFCSKLRLQIISNLISKKLFFTELKNLTNASDGNLSVQLKKLEGWEYIKSEKKLVNGKGVTQDQYQMVWNVANVYLTNIGKSQYSYLDSMRTLAVKYQAKVHFDSDFICECVFCTYES